MSKIISNKPPRGTSDWPPEEYRIREYIFNAWRQVCLSYGYEEYLTPLLENADIYRAKSGADVGDKELMILKDQGGRELAIRPEMTPSATRLVSKIYTQATKPLRLFSIANFMRNERPQRGRNREFWQLNCDIFGADELEADIEIARIALDIMLSFKPPRESFTLYVNSRKIIDFLLDKIIKIKKQEKLEVVRQLDKWDKIPEKDNLKILAGLGLGKQQIGKIKDFMQVEDEKKLGQIFPELAASPGMVEINEFINSLRSLGYGDFIKFKPNIIRGFDYYDGIVYEVFDNNPNNSRALFGGGRYNGLANLFGKTEFGAVGIAPGDETIRLFLESWDLIKDIKNNRASLYYLPLLSEAIIADSRELAKKLRAKGLNIEAGLKVQGIKKALDFANKKGFSRVIIFGEDEQRKGIYKVKNMATGEEMEEKLSFPS